MRPFRFIHAADLHLDSPFVGLTGIPKRMESRIRGSTFAAFSKLVDIAIRERVDFVLVAGDVFDLADRSLRAQLRFQQAAEVLAESSIPLFVIHGNHDPLSGARAKLNWPDSVVFFGSDAVQTVTAVNREGQPIAAISGISYANSATTVNLAAMFPKPSGELFSIAMLHTNVDGAQGHDDYSPCSKDQLIRAGYDYWALGHIHTRRMLHERPYIIYPGNIQGRSVKETGAKGCYVVDVDASGHAELHFHATEAIRWEQRQISIQDWTDEQQLKDGIERVMQDVLVSTDGLPAVLRLTLTGRGPLHRLLQEGTLVQEMMIELREAQLSALEWDGGTGPFVWLESCRVATGAEIPFERLLAQESFIGDLMRIAQRLLEDDERLNAFCSEAFAPLLGNPKASKLLNRLEPDMLKEWVASARELAVDELLREDGGASSA